MATLRILQGISSGTVYSLSQERTVLGRHPACQIVIDSGAVSRQHAQILENHGHFYLEDLRSRNCTYLNGIAVEGRAELKEGDTLKICDTIFAFSENGSDSVSACDPLKAEFRRLAEILPEQHVHYTGPLLTEIQADLLKEESVGRPILQPGFQGIVVLDAAHQQSLLQIDAFLRYAYVCICEAFGHNTDTAAFHPEQVAQVLKDESTSLFCFLNVQRFSEEDLHRLRGLGFTQSHHQVLYCGLNDYIAGKSLALIEDPADGQNTMTIDSQLGFSYRTGISAFETDSSIRIPIRQTRKEFQFDIQQVLDSRDDLEGLCGKVLEAVFSMFPQSTEGRVFYHDPDEKSLQPLAVRSRDVPATAPATFDSALVREVADTGIAKLALLPRDNISVSSFNVRSLMCVPLVSPEGGTLGAIQLECDGIRQRFTEDDLHFLTNVARQTALALENHQLRQRLLRSKEFERELEFAREIQLGMLPDVRPSIPGYETFDYYESSFQVGGDYFDYIPLPNGNFALAVADVAGRGVPAALMMARLQSSARMALLTVPSPSDAISRLNAEIASHGLGYRFVTFLLLVLDPQQHHVTVVNAGHLLPLLRRMNEVTEIGSDMVGIPLGVLPDQEFQEQTVELAPGDTLLLLTDGITEAMDPAQNLYGRHRLIRYLANGPTSAQELVEGLIGDLERFCPGFPKSDDSCVVCLRRLP